MMAGYGQSFEEIRRRETGANTPDMERPVKWFVELNCSSSARRPTTLRIEVESPKMG